MEYHVYGFGQEQLEVTLSDICGRHGAGKLSLELLSPPCYINTGSYWSDLDCGPWTHVDICRSLPNPTC